MAKPQVKWDTRQKPTQLLNQKPMEVLSRQF
jgi:hypothetical protein